MWALVFNTSTSGCSRLGSARGSCDALVCTAVMVWVLLKGRSLALAVFEFQTFLCQVCALSLAQYEESSVLSQAVDPHCRLKMLLLFTSPSGKL